MVVFYSSLSKSLYEATLYCNKRRGRAVGTIVSRSLALQMMLTSNSGLGCWIDAECGSYLINFPSTISQSTSLHLQCLPNSSYLRCWHFPTSPRRRQTSRMWSISFKYKSSRTKLLRNVAFRLYSNDTMHTSEIITIEALIVSEQLKADCALFQLAADQRLDWEKQLPIERISLKSSFLLHTWV